MIYKNKCLSIEYPNSFDCYGETRFDHNSGLIDFQPNIKSGLFHIHYSKRETNDNLDELVKAGLDRIKMLPSKVEILSIYDSTFKNLPSKCAEFLVTHETDSPERQVVVWVKGKKYIYQIHYGCCDSIFENNKGVFNDILETLNLDS